MSKRLTGGEVSVAVCGVDELWEYLPRATHLISIHTPGAREELPTFRLPKDRILELDFDDIFVPRVIDNSPFGRLYYAPQAFKRRQNSIQ